MTLLFAVADLSEGWGALFLIKSKASRAQILRAVLYQHTVAPAGALLVPLWQLGPLSIQPKSPEILVGTSNGRTISVWSDQNIRDQLWRWSTLTTLVFSVGRTEMSLSIWENCCPQCRSFLSCVQEQKPNRMYRSTGHGEFPISKFLLSGEHPTKSWKLYTGHHGALNSLHFFRVQPWYCANHSP